MEMRELMKIIKTYKIIFIVLLLATTLCCVGFSWPCKNKEICIVHKGERMCLSIKYGFATLPRPIVDENVFTFQDLP